MTFFTKPNDVLPATLIKSKTLNELAAATEAAFDALPDLTAVAEGRANQATCTNTGNAYSFTLPSTVAALTDGLVVEATASAANTGACTANVNALGAVSIRLASDAEVDAGTIQAGVPMRLKYSTSKSRFYLQAPLVKGE